MTHCQAEYSKVMPPLQANAAWQMFKIGVEELL